MRHRHPRRRRHIRTLGLIVTEGEITEKQYIDRLIQRLKTEASSTVSVITLGRGGSPEQVLQKAQQERSQRIRKGQSLDWCVCVFDVDEHPRIDAVIQEARADNIAVAVSRLKFETWLLWHVSHERKQLNSKALDREVRKHNLLRGKHLTTNFPIHAYQAASETAKLADPQLALNRIGPNPSSAMPALIEKFLRG